MQRSGTRTIHSASDISAFLACGHLTALEIERIHGGLRRPPAFPDPGTEVLKARGAAHEQEILAAYRARGLSVAEPPQPPPSREDDRSDVHPALLRSATATLDRMRRGVDVVYQGVLYDGTWQGRPDFLLRVDRPSALGDWSYEVVDAKLARSAKAGAVLQVCFYSELLEAAQGAAPEAMHLALGGPGGDTERLRVADYAAYYRTVKRRFRAAVGAVGSGGGAGAVDSYPEPCAHCTLCDWAPRCKEQWRADDHLSLVAGITRKQRARLEERDVRTRTALGALELPLDRPLDGVDAASLERVRNQARIQVEGERRRTPTYELIDGVAPGFGLSALPTPSDGDLFFDIEGDPHAFGDGLEYLLGWVDADGRYTGLWALDRAEEKARFEAFVDIVVDRLERWPDLHVYHYAAYEQTAVKRLAARHATREEEVDRLLRGQVFVDLYRVVRQGVRASVESYSIKKLEPLYGFGRDVELRSASSALATFEAWLELGGSVAGDGGSEAADARAFLAEVEGYNRDDCLSTLRLRAWLEERRTELEARDGPVARPDAPDPARSEEAEEQDERVQALMDGLLVGVPGDAGARSPDQQARWVLAHLLSWHRRERKSTWWEYFRLQALDDDELLQDGKALGGLEYEGVVATVKRSRVHRYRFPPQDFRLRVGDTPRDPRTEAGAGTIVALDDEGGTVDLKRGASSEVPHPASLVPFDLVPDAGLRSALQRLADDVIRSGLDGASNRAAVALLRRDPPRAGQRPGQSLRDDGERGVDAGRRLAGRLSGTVLPVQGPPGSGKTYLGARMIVTLLSQGKRVGITATSHSVIRNLLAEVCKVGRAEAVDVRCIQKADEDALYDHPFVTAGTNQAVEAGLGPDGGFNLAAGTVWLWSRPGMAGSVDVLFVDEAGQISLANALAASGAAQSLVLLGDPRQLEQPQQGVHPPGTDGSALEHLVGPGTLSAERGLFLEQTHRLHPAVCAFTSESYYEGRLSSRAGLDRQRVDGPGPFQGAGLRFVPVPHHGNTSESEEEARVVGELLHALVRGSATWTDDGGTVRPLGADDVLVVAPYNAQVARLRSVVPDGVRVGTVDKFQGRQAPVVVYSPATSTAEDAPRGMSFLFSPNRLNVATSRAKCLAVLVGNPDLLAPDCRSVAQMRLANGYCRFGEMAETGGME